MESNQQSIQYLNHIAIIMDGNGRWAQAHGQARQYGHSEGVNSVKSVVRFCGENGVNFITLFAFGQDNQKRPQEEINFLMALFAEQLKANTDDLLAENVKIKIIGDMNGLYPEVIASIKASEQKTAHCTGLQFTLAMNYSGHWDIAQASKNIYQAAQDNAIQIDDINKHNFADYLPSNCVPAIDLLTVPVVSLVLVTFVWQMAYAELYLTTIPWPEFHGQQLQQACEWFANRERRFGKTSATIILSC